MSQLPVYENWNKAYRIQKYGNWYVNPPLHLFFFLSFYDISIVYKTWTWVWMLKKITIHEKNRRGKTKWKKSKNFFFYFNNFISICIFFFCMCRLKNIQIWIFVLGLFFSKMFMHAIGHFVHIYMSF